MNPVGYNIRKVRELKNLSQKYLAHRLGISQSAYSAIENSKTELSFRRLFHIAYILGVDSDVLVHFSEEKALASILELKTYPEGKPSYEDNERLLKEKEREIIKLNAKLKSRKK